MAPDRVEAVLLGQPLEAPPGEEAEVADVEDAAKLDQGNLFGAVESLREAWEQTRHGIETQVEDDHRSYHQAGTD